MKQYVGVLRPTRENLSDTLSVSEEKVMAEHVDHLMKAKEAGVLQLAGPCEDEAFGLVLFTAESDEAAYGFMKNDPAVLGGLMTQEVHPFRIFVNAFPGKQGNI